MTVAAEDGAASPTVTTVAVVPYSGTGLARTEAWTALPDDEKRRRATTAAHLHDAAILWDLTEAHLTLVGTAGANVSPRTLTTYRQSIKRLVAEDWREWNLLKPERDAANLWLRRMEARDLKPGTVRTYLAAARALYAALRWSGATAVDPFKDVKPGRDPVAREEKRKPYTDDQVEQLLRVAFTPAERILVLLCGHAGLRASEAVDLTWVSVNLLAGRGGRLVVASGKGRKPRTVPLSGTLREELERYDARRPSPYVLPYRNRRMAWWHLNTMAKRAGVPALGVHALRHTAGTRIMRETGSLETTARLLGHSQIETARIYAKFADESLDEAVSSW